MRILLTSLSIWLAVLLQATLANAQETQETPSRPVNACENDPHFNDFDFWLGTWRVTAKANGQHAGDNVITKIEANCAVQENWTTAGGGTGMSLNYYNPKTGKWRQLWISAPGYLIDIEGGLVDNAMVLEGTVMAYGDGIEHAFRGTWTPLKDGTVRQFFEQYSEETKTWQPWFDGIYTRNE